MSEVEILGIADLNALRMEWSALCDRCPWATPFQRPEWAIPWCRAFPPWEPWIVAVREEGRLVGMLPLFLYGNGEGRTLAMVGAGLSDHLDLVAEPERVGEVTAAVWRELERRGGWDVCDLEQLRPESPLLGAAVPEGWREEVEVQDVCPELELPETIEELREAVPRRQLFNLRHFRRKMQALGNLRLEEAGEGSWEEVFAALVALHRARWAERGIPGVLEDPAVLDFHREVIPGFLARGALALLTLRLDRRIVAVYYGFYEKEEAYGYLQGYDAEWARFSPGVLLVGAALEEAVRRGARRYDFLRGAEAYKYRWGAVDRPNRRRRLRSASAQRSETPAATTGSSSGSSAGSGSS